MSSQRSSARLEKEFARLLAGTSRVAVRRRPDGCALVGGTAPDEWEVAVVLEDGSATTTATGSSTVSRRALRNALIGKASLHAEPVQHHVLGRVALGTSPARAELSAVAAVAARWALWLDVAVRRTPPKGDRVPRLGRSQVPVFWWDERSNFGDAIGPWLVQRISGMEPVNARRQRHLKPALYSVGSIFRSIDRHDVDVWGTGLMDPLGGATLERLGGRKDVRVHAVRGRRTREELVTKLGWDVPEVYGDPGLLLPRLYTPAASGPSPRAKVAFVPHYAHQKYVADAPEAGVEVVDVSVNLERVVDQIAGADACVSTSLHGVIVAQAYEVPWVWLRVSDHPLGGDTFKFEDFFSTLDESKVVTHDSLAEELATLDLVALAGRATLPDLTISLDALMDSFPVPRAAGAGKPFELPPLPAPPAAPRGRLARRAARLASGVRRRLRRR
ncbi:polysaccharide pyruvyl transferase family protein [Isoptericola sp. NPDC057653]|uniref:polysaccharide pyruvyl transferase family protein n=1 Tax=Isoptericola sp. NPDC057653 TaxID=3346195 RepID=UPI003699FBB3